MPMRIAASCPTHTRSDVTAVRQGHEFVIDEPPVRGGADAGPKPMEVLMASFAGCTNVIMNKIAGEQGMELSDVSIQVVGYLDTRGIAGAERIAAPFPEVRLTVNVRTNGTPAKMEELKKELAWRCPASVILRGAGSEVREEWNVTYS
jgi:uncharacterized OsmC-like protein